MPKVSILMNCFNGEKYLRFALDSIYSQSFENWEIIFVDNQSTDKSIEIASSYKLKIQIIKTPYFMNLGEARNFGLRYCTSKYIAFLDVDDLWLPEKLELQINAMENYDCSFCYTSWQTIDEKGLTISKINRVKEGIVSLSSLLERYDVNFQSLIIKRNELTQFDTKLEYAPDYKLCLSYAANFNGYSLNKNLVRYRKHNGSLTKTSISLWGDEVLSILNDLKINYPEKISLEYKMFNISVANGFYLKSRYMIEMKSQYLEAFLLLLPFSFKSFKCFLITCLSLFPFFWNYYHRDK
jgi:glycosyltransferase involved in cell wall biosynthesis